MSLTMKALVWLVGSFLFQALIMFLSAGTINWPVGWIYLILLYGFSAIGIGLLLRYNPGLLAERLKISQPNQKGWDRVFLSFFYLYFMILLVLMPLDAVRFHWSSMPFFLQVIGAIAVIVSFPLMGLVFRENSFLSPMVRIQEDRGQTVISTGPYHYVRHPLYAGGLFIFLGAPLLLGSWYGLLFTLVAIPGLMWRAVREEQTLRDELPGYDAYMAQVKYRLIPYVW